MNILYNAFMLYSRIPMPKSIICTDKTLNQALKYLPLVGLVIGLFAYGVYSLSNTVLPNNISVILAISTMILLTGALHEDGFADFCDGFGGGNNKESILRIMKDSHIGTYGVLGLILILLIRYSLLSAFDGSELLKILIISQGASRFAPVIMVRRLKYARIEQSKSSYTALGVSNQSIITAAIFALLPLLFFDWIPAIVYLGVMTIVSLLFRNYIYRRIGGFTGDTLGALQQIGEILFYVVFLIF